MTDLTQSELENFFDFLELKRGPALACWLCDKNDWSARKVRRAEQAQNGQEVSTLYVQLICKNCKQVADFTDRPLQGP